MGGEGGKEVVGATKQKKGEKAAASKSPELRKSPKKRNPPEEKKHVA